MNTPKMYMCCDSGYKSGDAGYKSGDAGYKSGDAGYKSGDAGYKKDMNTPKMYMCCNGCVRESMQDLIAEYRRCIVHNKPYIKYNADLLLEILLRTL